ncbi:MAG: hypothetical protein QM237_10845 [Bacteroidota bacterium]|jgi:hypothetical protein|nr:hypothetical protein [Bacteroidota bacterium]HHU96845.1 hypothetical protein [Petrimonas sp.]
MKTIYNAITARLKEKVPAIRWIDFDKGQLDSMDRPAVAFPCALLTISVSNARNITDHVQECTGRVRVRLAFDRQMKTDAATPPEHLEKALEPYDVIADVYAALQGFGTANFDPLVRARQDAEKRSDGLFVYFIEFSVIFEDETAEG